MLFCIHSTRVNSSTLHLISGTNAVCPRYSCSCWVVISTGMYVPHPMWPKLSTHHLPSFSNQVFSYSLFWLMASLCHAPHLIIMAQGIFFLIFLKPIFFFQPNYLSTTYPSSSLYPNDLFVYPSIFQVYHNSLLIIFPVFSFFLLKSALHRTARFAYLSDQADHVSFLVQNFPTVSEQGIHVLL